jgi:hypothetical protein
LTHDEEADQREEAESADADERTDEQTLQDPGQRPQ